MTTMCTFCFVMKNVIVSENVIFEYDSYFI